MKRLRAVCAAATIALIAGCGGGGGGSSPAQPGAAAPATAAPSAAAQGTASFALLIPSTSSTASNARRPAFVSSAIASVAVYAAVGTAAFPATPTTLVNVGPAAPGCTSVAAGTSCTINVPAVYGPMTFLVDTYSAPLGSGTLLSQASFTQTIVVNQPPIPLALSGAVASVALSLRTTSLPSGSGTAILDVNALDASGATIVGAGAYSVPISVTSSDASVTLSAASVTGPNQPITVTVSQPTIVEFTATAAGLSGNAFAPAILTAGSTYTRVFANSNRKDTIMVFPSIASFAMPPLYSIATAGIAAMAANASGTLVVADDAHELLTYAPGATTPSATMPLTYTVLFKGLTIDAAGNTYVIANAAGTKEILTYAPGATSAASYTHSISGAATGLTNPIGIVVDGAGDIFELDNNNYVAPQINEWTPGQSGNVAPARTFTLPAGAEGYDLAIAPSGTLAALTYLNTGTGGSIVQYFAGGATTPTSSWAPKAGNATGIAYGPDGSLYVGGSAAVGVLAPGSTGVGYSRSFGTLSTDVAYLDPIAVGGGGTVAPSPAVATVSGDFIAPAAGKTWNYTVTSPTHASYTLSVYSDPQPDVAGNIALVGFMSPQVVADAAAGGGTVVGAAGLARAAGGYTAQSFGSVSNATFGLVPGSPLLVPATLTYGQQLNLYPGVTAIVTGVGTVPGIGVCPNAPSTGATVAYTVNGSTSEVSYVPSCGITDLVTDAGADFRLTSVTQNPQLGQQDVARRVLSVTPVDTLRAVWKAVFRPWVKR